MSRLPVRQSVAERWTRIAFACALFAGALTATIFMLPAPKPPSIEPLANAGAAAPTRKPPRAPSEGVAKDWPAIASAVEGLNSPAVALWREEEERRKAEAARLAALNEGNTQPQFTSGGFAPPWKYLGSISDGEQRVALVVIDGRQRFVREGHRTQEGYRVLTIEEERLVIEQGSARHELRLESTLRPGPLSGTATAFPRPTPFRFEYVEPAQGGVRTSSGDTTPRQLKEGEPLSAERARQGLRGTPTGGGGGGR